MTRVKVCGITNVEHALAAAEAGADFIGLVMAPSQRQITPEQALVIARAVKAAGLPRRPMLVGVFVNRTPDEVDRIALECDLDYVQLSGDESWDCCRRIARPVIKAVHVGEGQTAAYLEAELGSAREAGALCLLDTMLPAKYGGGGKRFDWRLAEGLSGRFDFLLAGGLTPDNVAEAISAVHPWGLDVSSGVETGGVKDIHKIRAFIRAAKSAT